MSSWVMIDGRYGRYGLTMKERDKIMIKRQ